MGIKARLGDEIGAREGLQSVVDQGSKDLQLALWRQEELSEERDVAVKEVANVGRQLSAKDNATKQDIARVDADYAGQIARAKASFDRQISAARAESQKEAEHAQSQLNTVTAQLAERIKSAETRNEHIQKRIKELSMGRDGIEELVTAKRQLSERDAATKHETARIEAKCAQEIATLKADFERQITAIRAEPPKEEQIARAQVSRLKAHVLTVEKALRQRNEQIRKLEASVKKNTTFNDQNLRGRHGTSPQALQKVAPTPPAVDDIQRIPSRSSINSYDFHRLAANAVLVYDGSAMVPGSSSWYGMGATPQAPAQWAGDFYGTASTVIGVISIIPPQQSLPAGPARGISIFQEPAKRISNIQASRSSIAFRV